MKERGQRVTVALVSLLMHTQWREKSPSQCWISVRSAGRRLTCATALFPIVLTLATGFVTQVLQIHLHAFVILLRSWRWRADTVRSG